MMTFKDLKKLVELPSYKEQRVPTVKALEVSGVPVVAEKVLENHGSINVYQNGYVIYRAHKRVTVFSLRNCVHYKYDALEGAGHHIEEEEFDEYEWHIRLVLEGEDRIFMNYEIIQGKWMPSREDREYREEILEGVDEAVSTLERMISEERVEELLSTLTDLQRKVVHTHLFHGLSFTEAAKHLGMTRQNLTGIKNLSTGTDSVYPSLAQFYKYTSAKGNLATPSLEMFSSWIHAVVVLRNICAHNSRIYNRSLTTKPKLLSVDQQNPAPRYCGLYHFLLAMKYLRPSDDEWNDFITSFDALLNKYQRDIDLGKLHLPSDWRNHV